MRDYGFRNPHWMLKALIHNSPEADKTVTMCAIVDYLGLEEKVESETLLEMMAQLLAVGEAYIHRDSDEDIVAKFRRDMGLTDDEEDEDDDDVE